MSKVDAYRCDYCDALKPASEIIGVSNVPDMFDTLKSYPINANPEKCRAHFCTACYTANVFDAASRFHSKGRNRDAWQAKADELSYCLRRHVINKVFKPDLKEIRKGKK